MSQNEDSVPPAHLAAHHTRNKHFSSTIEIIITTRVRYDWQLINGFLGASEACCCDDRCESVESVATNLLLVAYGGSLMAQNCVNRGKFVTQMVALRASAFFVQRHQQKFQTIPKRSSQGL
jgi:hypothetical protein